MAGDDLAAAIHSAHGMVVLLSSTMISAGCHSASRRINTDLEPEASSGGLERELPRAYLGEPLAGRLGFQVGAALDALDLVAERAQCLFHLDGEE